MPETKTIRLANAAKEFNVATATIVEHLSANGFDVANRPTTKITEEMYNVLLKEFHKDKGIRERAEQISIGTRKREEVALEESDSPLPPKKEDKKEKKQKKEKKEVDPNKPKKTSGYLLYSADVREQVKAKLIEGGGEGKPKDVVQAIAAKWKALTDEETAVWNDKAKATKEPVDAN